jgi:hypothetical protein
MGSFEKRGVRASKKGEATTGPAAERRPFGEAALACQWGGWQGSACNDQ